MFVPAQCAHCQMEIVHESHRKALGVYRGHSDETVGHSTEPAPSGWIHEPHQTDWRKDYCNAGWWDKSCGEAKIAHHSAHPADNRSAEQDNEGWNRLGDAFDTFHQFNDIINNNNLNPMQFTGQDEPDRLPKHLEAGGPNALGQDEVNRAASQARGMSRGTDHPEEYTWGDEKVRQGEATFHHGSNFETVGHVKWDTRTGKIDSVTMHPDHAHQLPHFLGMVNSDSDISERKLFKGPEVL